MADKKISELASAGTLTGSETVPVVQSGSTVKTTLTAIYTWIVVQLGLRLLPGGGNPGEVLAKTSSNDYEADWTSAGLVPPGSVTGYVLTKTSGGPGAYNWSPVRAVPLPDDPADDGKVLRANAGDYAWQTPTLTPPAGSGGQIQYNDGGPFAAFAGAAYASIDGGVLKLTVPPSLPTAPAAGIKVFAHELGARIMPSFVGPNGLDSALQPFWGRNKIGMWSGLGNSSVAPAVFGILGATVIGTSGTRTVAATNLLTSLKRSYNVSGSGAGSSSGWRSATAQYFRSSNVWGGFFLAVRFGEDNTVTDSRCFVGMHTSTSAIGNVNPSTLTSLVGVGFDSSSSTWHVVHNDGSGTATMIDLGAGFPCNTNDEAYDLIISAPPGQTKVWVELIRLSTGGKITTEITTDLPALDAMLAVHIWANNGPTATAKGLNLSTLYIETDY